MRIVFLLVLLIGIGLAGFGVYMASEMFNRDQGELKQLRTALANQVDLGPVVVAPPAYLRVCGPLRSELT